MASRTSTPPAHLDSRLVEEIVHGEDIRRPLGLTRRYPQDAVIRALRYQARAPASFGGAKELTSQIRITATDGDVSIGNGPGASGTTLSLLLVISGRRAALDDLDGSGADALARLAGPDLTRAPSIEATPPVAPADRPAMRAPRHTEAVKNDVDLFVEALGEGWQRRACAQLLEDLRDAASLAEHIKWGHPYFDHDGAAVTKWFCAKGWINVYFFRGRELADPQGLFEHSPNSRMLTVRVTPDRVLDRNAFRDLVRGAAALAKR